MLIVNHVDCASDTVKRMVTTDLGASVDDMSELTDSQLCQFIDDDMP